MNDLNKRNRRTEAKRKHELSRKKRRKIEANKKYAERFRGKMPLDTMKKIVRTLKTKEAKFWKS